MVTKPESKLWQNLRDNTKDCGVFWTRIESWATPGIPDLHGVVDGHAFWVELKVHRLKSLKSLKLSPHQISWQTQYFSKLGSVWNLVAHPSSRTLNIFSGGRAMEIGGLTENKGELIPDYSTTIPYDWKGIISHFLS